MKLLMLHSNSIEIVPKKQAIKSAEEANKNELIFMSKCLVVFLASERDDINADEVSDKIVKEVKNHASQIGINRIMLYPYVHLTSKPGSPSLALDIINLTEEKLSKDFKVKHAPFGWYKEFKLHVKGHPLAELSREF